MFIRNLLLLLALNTNSISFEGLETITKAAILDIIGNETDADGIRIKLSDSGLFTKINISKVNGQIVVSVKEAPIITKIKWEGSNKIKSDILNKITGLKPGTRYTVALQNKLVSKIETIFSAKNTLVNCVCSTKSINNGLELIIDIQENINQSINTLEILGLKELSAYKISNQILKTKTGFFSSSYEIPLISTYIAKITQYARSIGYYEFHIKGHSLQKTGNQYKLILLAHEGSKYTLSELNVESEIIDNQVNISKAINKLNIGKPLSILDTDEAVKKITIEYEKLGYLVKVSPNYELLPDNKCKTIIKITKSQPILIQAIKVEGNKTSNRDMIIRTSGLSAGQTITQNSFANAKKNLERTGFFKSVDLEVVDTEEKLGSVNIKTEEVNTINLSLGTKIGYGITPFTKNISEPEFFWGVEAGYCTPNFLGEGYTISANAAWIGYAQMLNLSFGQSATVNTRNIGWNINSGINRSESGVSFTHTPTSSNTYIAGKTAESDISYYLLPNFAPNATKDSKDNPRKFNIDWTKYIFDLGFSVSFNITDWLSVGFIPNFSYNNIIFDDDEDNKKQLKNLPKIYNDDMFLKEYLNPSVELPIVFNFTELAPRYRQIGFRARIAPGIDKFNGFCNFSASYNWALDRDYLSNFSIKFSAGIMRPFDKDYWSQNYKSNRLLTGIASWGAKEFTTMTSLGGKEYIAVQAKLIVPIPYVDEFLRAYCFIAAGSIGNSGIKSEPISDETADRLGIRRGLNDVVNDEHSLRVSTGLGLMVFIGGQTIVSVGYNHILKADKMDTQQTLFITMDTSIDNA